MKILAVDDEKLALESLVDAIHLAAPDYEIAQFRNCLSAVEYTKENTCNIAFLDIEMRESNGIEIGKRLKAVNPKINIIFVTGYSEYMKEAFSMHASGYVLKPVTKESVSKELNNLRHPVVIEDADKINIQTFGNFEVFYKGKVVQFKHSKTKELLAYLIDRKGASCSIGEIAGILWEDRPESKSLYSQLRNLIADLNSTLKKINQDDALEKHRGNVSINPKMVNCDYFNWLNGNPLAINLYQGEYMSNYSWAEVTNASLLEK